MYLSRTHAPSIRTAQRHRHRPNFGVGTAGMYNRRYRTNFMFEASIIAVEKCWRSKEAECPTTCSTPLATWVGRGAMAATL
ncbi:hypothetical protein VTO73DRAFT_10060 [Trametes versicolor]